MNRTIYLLICIFVISACKNNSAESNKSKDCFSTIYEELNTKNSILFYPNQDSVFFKKEFNDFDSIWFAVNCLNIYSEKCWNNYNGDSILLINRSLEPNAWADGPFSVYLPDKIKDIAPNVNENSKRNNLDKLNVVRFVLFKDSVRFEQVYHIGVGTQPPSNYITTIDYESLDDMIGSSGNYGIGKGFHSECKILNQSVDVNVNYIVHSNKNPLYKCAGLTRCFTEKPVLFSVYDTTKSKVIQQHVGSSLSCNGSAHYPAKGMQVVARNKYGLSRMNAKFYNATEEYKNIRVRLGGSGQFSPPCQHVMDVIGHDLYGKRGLKNQFTSLYMNGSFWGVGYLQEKFDEHYIEKYYGHKEEFVDVLEIVGMRDKGLICQDSAFIRSLDKRGLLDSLGYHEYMSYADNYCWLATVKDGNGKAFTNFYNAALKGDFRQLNHQSLYDYLIHVDFITSRDPGRSSMFFCSNRNDPVWYAQAMDFDYAFNENPNENYWNVILREKDKDPFREIVRVYFEKEQHRIAFIKRYQDLLNTRYNLDTIIPKIEARIKEFQKEVEAHEYAWSPNALSAKAWRENCYETPYLQNYVKQRHQAVKQHLVYNFMGQTGFALDDQHKLSIKFPKEEDLKNVEIKVNSLVLQNDFEGYYFPWPSINVSVKNIPEGYSFIGWGNGYDKHLNPLKVFLKEPLQLEPIFVKN